MLKQILEYGSYVAVIVAAGLVSVTVGARWWNRPVPPSAIEEVELGLDAEFVRHTVGHGPIGVVEFSDFDCPFCQRHGREVVPMLLAEYSDQITYVFVHNPKPELGHATAIAKAVESECAAVQGAFWQKHGELFGIEPRELERAQALDEAALGACVADKAIEARVLADKAMANRLGATGTPNFLIGPIRLDGGVDVRLRINGAYPVAIFRQVIDRLVDQLDQG